MRYLRRKFDTWLDTWKADANRKPLLVKGARQVGKTETIRHFATNRYTSVVEVNFVLQPEFKQIVDEGYTVDAIVKRMSALSPHLRFVPGETLLFFDEIQEFPDVATAFKSFKQDGRYDVIASGSMLGVHYKQIASLPVGYKTDYTLRSLDFEEYLWACGYDEAFVANLEAKLRTRTSLDAMTMALMNNRFMDYCLTGGMPEIVRTFFDRGSFDGVLASQRQLMQDYRADVRKYAIGVDQTRILNVLDHIAPQLAKENKKFQITKVAKDARFRDYRGCVEWLKDAGVVNLCYAMTFPELPIKGNYDAQKFKMYFADSGLLIGQLDEETQRDMRARRHLGGYKGGIYENIVAEALVKSGCEIVYYRREDSQLEEDFFVRDAEHLIPVEVKSEREQSKSLRTLIKSEHYPDISWGIKFAHENVGFENDILTLPHWSAFLLKRLLANPR